MKIRFDVSAFLPEVGMPLEPSYSHYDQGTYNGHYPQTMLAGGGEGAEEHHYTGKTVVSLIVKVPTKYSPSSDQEPGLAYPLTGLDIVVDLPPETFDEIVKYAKPGVVLNLRADNIPDLRLRWVKPKGRLQRMVRRTLNEER